VVALVFSGIGAERFGSFLAEAAPAVLGVVALVVAWPRFRFTPLVYRLVFVHALLLIYAAHYTYALTPAGEWLQHAFGLARNPFDRIGHFAQGFVPALIVREILLRKTPLVRGGWLFTLVTAVCLAISACWEFLEWGATIVTGQGPDAVLASQGDVWDTQWDMLMALTGAVLAQLLFARPHDRQLLQRSHTRPGS
jgi:putative membrane protein